MSENWEVHWKDYFKILQVDSSAEPEVIKAAYNKLAQKYHPDKNKSPTASSRMKEINEAYSILNEPEKKARYDKAWLTHQREPNSDFSERPYNDGARTSKAPPKPVADVNIINIPDAPPYEVKTMSFFIRNDGGSFKQLFVNNTPPWLDIQCKPLTNAKLPMKVDITAIGKDWGARYFHTIVFKLDEQECKVSIYFKTTLPYTTGSSRHTPQAPLTLPQA